MLTTALIKILQSVEHGASGRPREISILIEGKDFLEPNKFLSEPDISIASTGDGCAGSELCLFIAKNNHHTTTVR